MSATANIRINTTPVYPLPELEILSMNLNKEEEIYL
jgi:hypothetical protein